MSTNAQHAWGRRSNAPALAGCSSEVRGRGKGALPLSVPAGGASDELRLEEGVGADVPAASTSHRRVSQWVVCV